MFGTFVHPCMSVKQRNVCCDIQGFILKQCRCTCLARASGMFNSIRECGIRPDRSNVPTNICQTLHLFY